MSHRIHWWTDVHRSATTNLRLGCVLAGVAGATNAGGFLAVGQYTSHMSGILSSVADNLILGQMQLALVGVALVAAFIGGSMTTAWMVNWALRRNMRSAFARPLVVEAGLLLVFGIFGTAIAHFSALFVPVTVLLLCYIMGLQNAVITKVSHAEIRTTHVTGLLTDLGIELGKLFYLNGAGFPKKVVANRGKLRIHTQLVASFFSGALLGAFGFKHAGYIATVPLALLLLLLTWGPIADDLRHGRPHPKERSSVSREDEMSTPHTESAQQSARHWFRPRIVDALQGYNRQRFSQDVGAGLTVGVVALPLAMAFAIASGLKPEAGLFTAIIAGLIVSLLGGSRVQIAGPAGAFIVIVYGIVERYGLANLIIATAMSGVMLFAMGFFRLGTLIRFIPVSVVIGFTNGIAVLVAVSQIKDFLGLRIASMPADFFGILSSLRLGLPTLNGVATILAIASLGLIVLWQYGMPRLGARRQWARRLALVPGAVVALVVATLCVAALDLPVETVGSRFGGIPSALPTLQWPDFSWASARFLFIPAMTLALLGAIESLLCARVADGMIDDRHNPNQELMAQGVANFVVPFFGGMPATGTIARTVTNVKSGATSPIAGVVHAATLLLVVLVAAPLARNIPLAAMAAILMFVAWNMGEWREFWHLRQYRLPYRVTLLAVFFLTVVFDLTVAVEVGLVAACITFIYRISSLSRCEPVVLADYPGLADVPDVAHHLAAYRLYGALFFGAVKLVEDVQDKLPAQALVLDLKNVIYIDSSGADALADLARCCRKHRVRLLVCGLMHQPLDIARRSGLVAQLGEDALFTGLTSGLAAAAELLTKASAPPP